MHMPTVLGLLLSMLTLVARGWRLEKRESARSKVLKAILQQERDYDVMSKRDYHVRTVEAQNRMECCPSETKFIEPLGGLSRDGRYLQLYRDEVTVQRLQQTTCHPHWLNQPCRLLAPEFTPLSRCVQKFSYVYAFVKDFNRTENYRLDYVKVRSGCACEVDYTTLEQFV